MSFTAFQDEERVMRIISSQGQLYISNRTEALMPDLPKALMNRYNLQACVSYGVLWAVRFGIN